MDILFGIYLNKINGVIYKIDDKKVILINKDKEVVNAYCTYDDLQREYRKGNVVKVIDDN